MADLFTVTAPLAIRYPNGERHYLPKVYKHPKGVLCFNRYWHQKGPDEGTQLIKGWLEGDGPWKIGGYVISVLACHNTVACPAEEYSEWKAYLQNNPGEYPPEPLIDAIAKRLGAELD